MGRYVLRRLLWMPVVMFVLVTISFFLIRLAPGGPFSGERNPDPAILAAMEEKYGLDDHLIVQYGRYVLRVAQGDLGPSFKRKDFTVNQIIAAHLGPSVLIGAAGTVLALFLGLGTGVISAVRQNSVFDYSSMSVAMFGMSVPAFVTGPILVLIFGLAWGILPVAGYSAEPVLVPAYVLIGLYVAWRVLEWHTLDEPGRWTATLGLALPAIGMIGWTAALSHQATAEAAARAVFHGDPAADLTVPWIAVLAGVLPLGAVAAWIVARAGVNKGREAGAFWLWALVAGTAIVLAMLEQNHELILPAVVLALPFASRIARLMRAGMLEVVNQDYIRTARAKGLSETVVIVRHALKGGMLPVVSFLGPAMAALLTGSLVVEQIFAIPGIGREFVESATSRDYFLVLGTVILYGGLLILFNMVVDLAYGFLDPRIRYE